MLQELSMRDTASRLIAILMDNGHTAYLVGGCVRDEFMGLEPHDYDICTSATPEEIKAIMKEEGFFMHFDGEEFGTIKVNINKVDYEITTYRGESAYRDGRHPDAVMFKQSVEDDLSRRDFTINAMAINPIDCETVDIFGGREDIERKVIKAVGDPNERFKEDALRILRAMRFAVKLGFTIEENTLKAMIANKELLNKVSKERITEEFRKLFTSGKPVKQVFTDCQDIIAVLIPEMKKCIGFDHNNKYHWHDVYQHILYVVDYCETTKFEIKMAAFLHDIEKPTAYSVDDKGWGHYKEHPEFGYKLLVDKYIPKKKADRADRSCEGGHLLKNRFALSSDEFTLISNLVREHDRYLGKISDKNVHKFVIEYGEPFIRDWLILKLADIKDHINLNETYNEQMVTDIENRLNEVMETKTCFKIADMDISGNDIMEFTTGKPGKHVGTILTKLFKIVVNGGCPNEHEKLMHNAKIIWRDMPKEDINNKK